MLRLTCTADFSQLGDFNTVMGRVLNKTIQLIAQDYSDEVKRQITKKHVIDTGNMKNSILINLIYRGAQVVSGVEYLPYQNDGTGIYGKYRTPIVPKQKKALVFTIAGKTFVRKSVKGVKGKHFVEDAFDKFKDGTRIKRCLGRALRQCGFNVQ